MRWNEIDPAARMWTIPAKRMKSGRPRRVPLTDAMMALIEAQPRQDDDAALVFSAPRGGQLSDMALGAVMKKIATAAPDRYRDEQSGRPAVPHGLRSTFRDWCAVQGIDRDLAEIALAHTVGSNVERAYRRSDMVERRRAVMAAWGEFLAGRGDVT
ncbi:MAG: site-specific integrase [Roseovarius sp.]|nr:site-specific integrase [Roseovarius sp.]